MSSHAARTDPIGRTPAVRRLGLAALLRRCAVEIRDFWARHPLEARYWPPHP